MGHLKSKMYTHPPRNIEEPKERMRERKCRNSFGNATPHRGRHAWKITGMSAQRRRSPRGYHHQEINGIAVYFKMA
jgi:hypothetical protein